MNTNNFAPFDFPEGEDVIRSILEKHCILTKKYFEYEPDGMPEDFDINVYEDQKRIKDFLQIRFIEELCEATLDTINKDHFLEELGDAFGFLLSAYLMYHDFDIEYTAENLEWKDKQRDSIWDDCQKMKASFYFVVEQVGATCNLLKNRPWKKTHYIVDLYKFEPLFYGIFSAFNRLCNECGFTLKDIYSIWSQKYQCNLWRMETEY